MTPAEREQVRAAEICCADCKKNGDLGCSNPFGCHLMQDLSEIIETNTGTDGEYDCEAIAVSVVRLSQKYDNSVNPILDADSTPIADKDREEAIIIAKLIFSGIDPDRFCYIGKNAEGVPEAAAEISRIRSDAVKAELERCIKEILDDVKETSRMVQHDFNGRTGMYWDEWIVNLDDAILSDDKEANNA